MPNSARSQNMTKIDNSADNDGACGKVDGHHLINVSHQPSRFPSTALRQQLIIGLLFAYFYIPSAAGQRQQHQRLWPPRNIEPCSIQCPVQHVQMTGNRTLGTDMSYWGAQPIVDFMSNSQWQTVDSPPQTTMLAVDVAASSPITTLRTSFMPTALPTAARSERRPIPTAVASAAGNAGLFSSFGFVYSLLVSCSAVLLSQDLF